MLAAEVRERLRGLTGHLELPPAWMRWENAEKYHLTLLFLGPQPAEKEEAMQRVLQAAHAIPSFPLTLQGLGAFPAPASGRVLWTGIAENPAVMNAQRRLQRAAAAEGFVVDERPYHPHVTIARCRRAGRDLSAVCSDRRAFGTMQVQELVLMQSRDGQYQRMATEVLA